MVKPFGSVGAVGKTVYGAEKPVELSVTIVTKGPTDGLTVIVTLAVGNETAGEIIIVRLAHIAVGLELPLLEILMALTTKAVDLPFFGLPPPVSATAIPNPPSSNSNRGMILAINNRGDIEIFFKLKFLFVIV